MFSISNAITSTFEIWDLPAEIVTETQLWTYLKDQHSMALAKIGNLTTALFNEQIGPRNQRQQREQFLKEGREFMDRAIDAFNKRHRLSGVINKEIVEICRLYKFDPAIQSKDLFPFKHLRSDEDIGFLFDWVTEFYLNHIEPEIALMHNAFLIYAIDVLVCKAKENFPENEKIKCLHEVLDNYPQTTVPAYFEEKEHFKYEFRQANSPEMRQEIFNRYFVRSFDWGSSCSANHALTTAQDFVTAFCSLEEIEETVKIAAKVFVMEGVKRKLNYIGKSIFQIADFPFLSKESKIELIQISFSELAKLNWDFEKILLMRKIWFQRIESLPEIDKSVHEKDINLLLQLFERIQEEAKESKNLVRPETYKYFPPHSEKRELKPIHHLEGPEAPPPHAKKQKMTALNPDTEEF